MSSSLSDIYSAKSEDGLGSIFVPRIEDVANAFKISGCKLSPAKRTVIKWFDEGCPGKTADGYDLLSIAEWRFTQGLSEDKILMQKETLLRAQLRNAETEKRLISKNYSKNIFFKVGSLIKGRLLPLASKISSAIKGETDVFVIDKIIENQVRVCIEDLAESFIDEDFETIKNEW